MKKIQKTILLSLTLIVTILFIGCGSGGSNSEDGTTIVFCTTNDASTNTTWTTVNSNNTITVTTGTQLLWKQTTIKQVCVKSGTGSAKVN